MSVFREYNLRIIFSGLGFGFASYIDYVDYQLALLGWILTSILVITRELDRIYDRIED